MTLQSAIEVLCVLVLFFVAVRFFWWWYFGISRIVNALESIDESLKCLPAVRDSHDVMMAPARRRAS